MTLADLIHERAQEHADRPFLIAAREGGDVEVTTFGEMLGEARRVQGWLEEETGVKLGAGGSSAPRATAEPAPACQLSARRGQGRSDAGGFVAAVLLGGALFGMRRSR